MLHELEQLFLNHFGDGDMDEAESAAKAFHAAATNILSSPLEKARAIVRAMKEAFLEDHVLQTQISAGDDFSDFWTHVPHEVWTEPEAAACIVAYTYKAGIFGPLVSAAANWNSSQEREYLWWLSRELNLKDIPWQQVPTQEPQWFRIATDCVRSIDLGCWWMCATELLDDEDLRFVYMLLGHPVTWERLEQDPEGPEHMAKCIIEAGMDHMQRYATLDFIDRWSVASLEEKPVVLRRMIRSLFPGEDPDEWSGVFLMDYIPEAFKPDTNQPGQIASIGDVIRFKSFGWLDDDRIWNNVRQQFPYLEGRRDPLLWRRVEEAALRRNAPRLWRLMDMWRKERNAKLAAQVDLWLIRRGEDGFSLGVKRRRIE